MYTEAKRTNKGGLSFDKEDTDINAIPFSMQNTFQLQQN